MKPLHRLLATQFLTAVADNMILLATIYVIFENKLGLFYTGIVQASFFIAYILLAPYASILSEKLPKANTLWIGNIVKLTGAAFLFFGLDPALSYAIIGIGACIYGPSKYAILKELTETKEALYRANGLVEGSTIVAILLGTVVGGMLVNISFTLAMAVIVAFYIVSFIFAYLLPRGSVSDVSFKGTWKHFWRDTVALMKIPAARTSVIGTSNFWMNSAVLRLAVLAWIPIAFGVGSDVASYYMGVTAIGIMLGAVLSPKIIPLNQLSLLLYMGIGLSGALFFLALFPHKILTAVFLLLIGLCGGMFQVPLNTTLQQTGDEVGSGKIIAIQNFFENILMLAGTLLYTTALRMDIDIPYIMMGFALIFLCISVYVNRSYKRLGY